MKKLFFICLFLIFINFSMCFGDSLYNSTDTMSFDEYLNIKKSRKDWKTLKLNKNGDVTFKNKIILTQNGTPLNDNSAYTTMELKTLFTAQGIKPRKWCNPKNTAKNGSLGCYIDNPDN